MRIFKEEQRFTQTWLFVLLAITAGIPILVMLNEYINHPDTFNTSEGIVTILIILATLGLIFIFKLTTRIDENGIHYKFFPIHWKFKTITWTNINKAYVKNYDAISDYGGWGYKGGVFWKKSKGSAINVSGDIGIQLELKNGKKLLIGTQKKLEASEVLKTYIKQTKEL